MRGRSRLIPGALLLVYLALATGYTLANPLYESTDEVRHFRYVRHLVVNRSLPVQHSDAPRAQSHHPPLYYFLGALISGWVPVAREVYYAPVENPFWAYRYWEVGVDNKIQYVHGDDERFPFRDVALAVYLVRCMTILMGAGGVWLTYRTGCEVFRDRPALALGGAALVGFNPQFLYLSGAINNDIPAALCGAAVVWTCTRLVRNGPSLRTDVTLGVLFGLALLTKFHLLALAGVMGLAYALAVWWPRQRPRGDRQAGGWRAVLRGALVIVGLSAVISGWWFLRNWRLYGDPTGLNKVNELWAGRSAAESWWAIGQGLPYLWSTLWGRFGYGQVPMPQPVYHGLLVFSVLAVAGCLLPRRRPLPSGVLPLLTGTSLAFAAVVFYYMLIQPAGAMGRFLFPALPAVAVLLFLGLVRFFPRRYPWAASLIVTIGMAALATYALVGVLAPAFAPPRPLTASEIEAVPNRVSVEFGGVGRVVGYEVTPRVVEPGGTIVVTLYWETMTRTDLDYAVFVHVLSEVGAMVAQRDTYPGLGRYPTTNWEPHILFADTYRVHIPETAYAPDQAVVQVGLYLPNGPRLATPDGDDALRLTAVEIRPVSEPQSGEFPNPLTLNFDTKAMLVGYALDRRVVEPGETVRLTLYWQALAPMDKNYSIIAHVLGVENQVWARNSGWPAGGSAPTGAWAPGQVVEDVRDLTVGLTTPPSFYDIELAVYDDTENKRLPIVAADGHWLDDRVLLSKIRVVGDE